MFLVSCVADPKNEFGHSLLVPRNFDKKSEALKWNFSHQRYTITRLPLSKVLEVAPFDQRVDMSSSRYKDWNKRSNNSNIKISKIFWNFLNKESRQEYTLGNMFYNIVLGATHAEKQVVDCNRRILRDDAQRKNKGIQTVKYPKSEMTRKRKTSCKGTYPIQALWINPSWWNPSLIRMEYKTRRVIHAG